MTTTSRVGRSLAALAAATLLAAVAGCSGDSSLDGSEDRADATRDPWGTTTEPSEASAETDAAETTVPPRPGAGIPLSEEVSAGESPAWALPVVDGWSVPQELQPGVFQIGKDGTDVLVTAYQLSDPSASDAEQGARAWLDKYHTQIVENPGTDDVDDPTYATAELESSQGPMEFVVQELAYGTPSGTRYRSWYAARWVDGYVFAFQYAAPLEEWDADEIARLGDEGLQLAL